MFRIPSADTIYNTVKFFWIGFMFFVLSGLSKEAGMLSALLGFLTLSLKIHSLQTQVKKLEDRKVERFALLPSEKDFED